MIRGVALLSVGAAVIHLSAARDHTEHPSILAFFIVLAALQVAWAALVVVRTRRWVLAVGILLSLAVIGTWIVSRTTGMPVGPEAGVPEPIGFKDLVATAFELLLIAGAGILLVPGVGEVRLSPGPGPAWAPALIGAAVFALAAPALILEGQRHGEAGHVQLAATASRHAGQPVAGGRLRSGNGPVHRAHGGVAETSSAGVAGGDHAGQPSGGSSTLLAASHLHPVGATSAPSQTVREHVRAPSGGVQQHERGHRPASHAPGPALGPGHGQDVVLEPGAGGHHATCRPTPEQRRAAEKLLADTKAAIAKYDSHNRALADGYIPYLVPANWYYHYLNYGYVQSSDVLNPERPESLLYGMTDDRGYAPIGALYIMPEPGMKPPEVGGCLTPWHTHSAFFARRPWEKESPPMLHVWTIPRKSLAHQPPPSDIRAQWQPFRDHVNPWYRDGCAGMPWIEGDPYSAVIPGCKDDPIIAVEPPDSEEESPAAGGPPGRAIAAPKSLSR